MYEKKLYKSLVGSRKITTFALAKGKDIDFGFDNFFLLRKIVMVP